MFPKMARLSAPRCTLPEPWPATLPGFSSCNGSSTAVWVDWLRNISTLRLASLGSSGQDLVHLGAESRAIFWKIAVHLDFSRGAGLRKSRATARGKSCYPISLRANSAAGGETALESDRMARLSASGGTTFSEPGSSNKNRGERRCS